MLTHNTFRVTRHVMTFHDIIKSWGSLGSLAADLDLPVKNVRRWEDTGSIPADWYLAVVKAAKRRGFNHVTLPALCAAAQERRLARSARPSPSAEAA